MAEHGKKKKRLGVALFVTLNVIVIGVTAYSDFGAEKSGAARELLDVNMLYLLLVALCFTVTLGAETLKYYIMAEHTTGLRLPREAFEVAALGKYYDYITPLGAGGQPFQMIYLSNQGIDTGPATAMPIVGFISLQAAFILIGIVVLSTGAVVQSAALIVPAIIGICFYAAVPLLTVMFAFKPDMTKRFIDWCIRALAKLKLVRKPEEAVAAFERNLASAISSLRSICNGKGIWWKMLGLSLVFQIALCSMPFFVLRAFGNTLPFLDVFRSCVYIYLCITFVPTPGNSGAAEGSFYMLFSVLDQGRLFWAMLVWRMFCYYSYIITGLAVTWLRARRKKAAGSRETL